MNHREFAVDPSAPMQARLFLREVLADHPCTSNAQLAVSELVSNVVRHQPLAERISVDVRMDPDRVRIEVTSKGAGPHTPLTWAAQRASPAADQANGHGLGIVDSISAAWGVSNSTVWCEIPS